jgi:hypothetical protein
MVRKAVNRTYNDEPPPTSVTVNVALSIIDITQDLLKKYDKNIGTIFDVLATCRAELDEEKRLKRDTYLDAYAMLGFLVSMVNEHARKINEVSDRYKHD